MKKTKLVTGLAFLLFFLVLALGCLWNKGLVFSENENRYLAGFPKLTWDNFINGKFQEDLEDYLKDHIPGRDRWMSGRTAVTQAVGGCEIDGVYLGSDSYLFQKIAPQEVDEENLWKNVKYLLGYFEAISNNVDRDCISFLLVPTADFSLENKMPKYAIQFRQDRYLEGIKNAFLSYNYVDVRSVFSSQGEDELYYKTDHHWNSLGAYYGYRVWCQRTNHVVQRLNRFEVETVSDSFRGTLYSKALNVNASYDEVVRYERMDDYRYEIVKDGLVTDSFYDEDALSRKNQYDYFLGGNYREVVIERLATKDDNAAERNLLLIKDSFANSFVPFIAAEYDHIYMIDLRYYNEDLQGYIEEHDITDVLVLYGVANFMEDQNLRKLSTVKKPEETEPEEPAKEPEEPEKPSEGGSQQAENWPVIETDKVPKVQGNLILFGDRAFEYYTYKNGMSQRYADGLNLLEQKLSGKVKVYDLLVPLGSGIMFPDAYAGEYYIEDQRRAMEDTKNRLNPGIGFVDAYASLMAHRNEYLYFRTDHHWTGLGAYYAYEAFCKTSGRQPVPLENYEAVTYDGFLGSLYRESQSVEMQKNPDSVTAYKPLSDSQMTITDIYGKLSKEGILANGDLVPASDKYCVFIHGDHPFADVENKNLSDGSSCIVVKESYGNAFIPFLIEHYQHVYVVDYRYWNGNLEELVEETGAEELIFVNNLYAIRNQYLLGKILGIIYK